MTPIVRAAQETDAPAMVALLNPIIAAGGLTAVSRPVHLDEQIAFVRDFPARGIFLVAAVSGDLAGMRDVAPVGDGVGEISTFVALDRRRSGVGRVLTTATLNAARARGFRLLRATILSGNSGARRFYAAMGFVEFEQGSTDRTVAELSLAR